MLKKKKKEFKKLRSQARDWEKMYPTHLCDKELLRIYKELSSQLQENKQLDWKWAKDTKTLHQESVDAKYVCEKKVEIISHQGNANENHALWLHTDQKGYRERDWPHPALVRTYRYCSLVTSENTKWYNCSGKQFGRFLKSQVHIYHVTQPVCF